MIFMSIRKISKTTKPKTSDVLIKRAAFKIIANEYIKSIAKANKISVGKCRKEIKYAIQEAGKKPSSLFIEVFGNKTPSIEEFIVKFLILIEKEEQKNNDQRTIV